MERESIIDDIDDNVAHSLYDQGYDDGVKDGNSNTYTALQGIAQDGLDDYNATKDVDCLITALINISDFWAIQEAEK